VSVGRAQELEQVFELLERARAGGGGFALLTDEAGIGKTRLAEELTRAPEGSATAAPRHSW
jgi:predicted ATPase